ncbi:copper chaperone PCu(A)C [Tahibacter caeni]|uniref:copper chaperone PCu(A)C n=1 Tax=Tahibacter caeni TaxID=1453545 RepID=UPI0021480B0A|nr:copper chaperone PCu(A)C [Tahibacter caeni]
MKRVRIRWAAAAVLALGSGAVEAAGRLAVDDAWIRTAPPAASMRAGYATLRNVGDAPLQIRRIRSDAFGDVSLHATVVEDGVARMREIEALRLAPGEEAVLEPGGKHLMLMQPQRELAAGATATVIFDLDDGATTATADFVVRDADAAATEHVHH